MRGYNHSLKCFRHEYTIIRREQGHIDNEGRYVQSERTTSIKFSGASPQPINDRDLVFLPDGLQSHSLVKTYTDSRSVLFGDHVSIVYPENNIPVERHYRVVAVSTRDTHTRIYMEQLHRPRHD